MGEQSDMIERVAEALWRGSNKQLRSNEAWAGAFEAAKDAFRDLARAAIEAMRPIRFGDLPEEMALAGEEALDNVGGVGSYGGAHDLFAAMIGAALGEREASHG